MLLVTLRQIGFPITWLWDCRVKVTIETCREHLIKCLLLYSNLTSFFRFVDKRAIYRRNNLFRTCTGQYDWLFYWQHKLCAIFSANGNINYRFPIKVYYLICTLRHIRIEINHGSQCSLCLGLSTNIRQSMLKLKAHFGFHDLCLNEITALHSPYLISWQAI